MRGKSLQRRKEMKWTVASALETKGELGWGMKFVVCVRVRLTQGTVDNHGVRRGVLANGFVRVEDLRAGGMGGLFQE